MESVDKDKVSRIIEALESYLVETLLALLLRKKTPVITFSIL